MKKIISIIIIILMTCILYNTNVYAQFGYIGGAWGAVDFNVAAGWTYTDPNHMEMTDPNDVLIIGDTLRANTNTDGFVFMGDGTNYAPEAINLGTDTAGNYCESITTTSPITGGLTAAEGTDHTIAITVLKDLVTTSPLTGGTNDILTGGDADITLGINVLKDLVTTAPLTGGTNDILPGSDTDITIAMPVATTSADGYLSQTDWDTFNNKQSTLTNEAGLYGALSDVSDFTQPSANETVTGAWVFIDLTATSYLLSAPSNQTASGEKDTYTVDSSAAHTVFGQPYYFHTDGELQCASVADPNSPNLAVVLAITTGTGASKTCLKRGQIRDSSWGWTKGSYVYLSDDPNTPWTQTAPTAIQVIGLCEDDPNQFYFNPQPIAVK